MLKTEAIKGYLKQNSCHPYAERYSKSMEVQVNVARDNGNRVSYDFKGKKRAAWTDGISTWKSFRIPYGAKDTPIFNDSEIQFSLVEHAEAIGMTGWDWENKISRWVGFDIDSISNHLQGISSIELEEVKKACITLDYVTVVKSTSGKGLHLYIDFDSDERFSSETHTEHASLAASVLSIMTLDTGYDLKEKVDCFGGILWVYSRRQIGTEGFTIVKKATNTLPYSRIPANWKDPIKKEAYRNNKKFQDIFSSMKSTIADENHRKLLKWFSSSDGAEREYWWDSEHSMLVCHTRDLLKAHNALNLSGVFTTDSSGSSDQNCFCFPEPDGAWVVRRHGMNIAESKTWLVDETGWVKCYLNKKPTLTVASLVNKAIVNQRGDSVFKDLKDGVEALSMIGVTIDLPDYMLADTRKRQIIIRKKEGLLTVILEARDGEEAPDNFILTPSKKNMECSIPYWEDRTEIPVPDNLIRYTISSGVEAGWFLRIKDSWVQQAKSNIATVLMAELNISKVESESYMGKIIMSPWFLANEPFAKEYLGNRLWNRDSACFACKPEEGNYDTWLSVLTHCGSGMDDAVEADEWCKKNDITSGADYLLCWFANLIQRPKYHLPYLFFIGDQNTGKSTLHEAFGQFIIKKGYTRADNALLAKQGFNGELNGAVLCVVEETNLQKNKEAGDKIKDWVTGKTISIRAMYKNAFDVINHTHWIQCANSINYCVVSDKDTRVVVASVPMLESEIPKHTLFNSLEAEAPAFLNHLLTLDLPEPEGRLAVSCITTAEKQDLLRGLQSDVSLFFEENGKHCDGWAENFDTVYETFHRWLPSDKRQDWTKIKFSMAMPTTGNLCRGKMGSENVTYIANYSLDKSRTGGDKVYRRNIKNNRLNLV